MTTPCSDWLTDRDPFRGTGSRLEESSHTLRGVLPPVALPEYAQPDCSAITCGPVKPAFDRRRRFATFAGCAMTRAGTAPSSNMLLLFFFQMRLHSRCAEKPVTTRQLTCVDCGCVAPPTSHDGAQGRVRSCAAAAPRTALGRVRPCARGAAWRLSARDTSCSVCYPRPEGRTSRRRLSPPCEDRSLPP